MLHHTQHHTPSQLLLSFSQNKPIQGIVHLPFRKLASFHHHMEEAVTPSPTNPHIQPQPPEVQHL